jgi:hypothetical protein
MTSFHYDVEMNARGTELEAHGAGRGGGFEV